MRVADLEAVDQLSPLQQERLSHALEKSAEDAGIGQVRVALSGPLSLPALQEAWARLADRHAALRTSFRPWKVPARVVQRRVTLPFAVHERSGAAEIASFLAEDRARGFDPTEGPLVRLSVLRTAPGEHLLVFTYHRLVLEDDAAARIAEEALAAFAGYPAREDRESVKGFTERATPPLAMQAHDRHEIVPVPRDRPLPATFYQEWGLQLDGITKNSIPTALRITGRIDLPALRRSLTEIVRRHESLRTSFRWQAGEAYLVIASPSEVPLPIVDLAALPAERRTDLLHRLLAEHAEHEFDLARGPLFIAQVVRLGEQDQALLLNVHHLVADGWSIQVLERELMVLYTAFIEGRPSPLPPLPIQLADFAHWQRRVFAGAALAAQLAWWRKTLADVPPPPELPADLPRPEVVGPRAVDLAVVLPPEPVQSLKALAEAEKGSLPMVLAAAVDALLHVWSGQEDLVISMIFAARNRPELSNQIGLFMNTVPLRVDLAGNPSFRQVVERVRDATIDVYSHQDVPFPRLIQELFPGRKPTRTVLSGVCFNMLSFSEAAGTSQRSTALPGGLTLQQLGAEEGGAKYDLTFTCTEGGGSIHVALTGAADLFSPERMTALAEKFETLLAHVAADPDIPLDRLRQVVQKKEGRMEAPPLPGAGCAMGEGDGG